MGEVKNERNGRAMMYESLMCLEFCTGGTVKEFGGGASYLAKFITCTTCISRG